MIVLLDIIGAIIAGTMVIITIVNSIFNIQQMNYNIQTLLSLNTVGNEITEFIDLTYLESVGRNLKSTDQIISTAKENEFTFFTKPSYADTVFTQYTITAVQNSLEQTYISVLSDSVEVFNSLPFQIKESNIFTYYIKSGEDADGHIIYTSNPNPNLADLEQIFYVKVSLIFIEKGWNKQQNLTIEYPVVFWRFFKNNYLNKLNI